MSDPELKNPITPVVGATEPVREQDRIFLVLAYLGLLALIPLLTVKDSPYVQWHAKNGLVLGLGGGVAVSLLASILGLVPLIGCLAWPSLVIIYVALHLVAIKKALEGVRWRIPFVSDIAEKL